MSTAVPYVTSSPGDAKILTWHLDNMTTHTPANTDPETWVATNVKTFDRAANRFGNDDNTTREAENTPTGEEGTDEEDDKVENRKKTAIVTMEAFTDQARKRLNVKHSHHITNKIYQEFQTSLVLFEAALSLGSRLVEGYSESLDKVLDTWDDMSEDTILYGRLLDDLISEDNSPTVLKLKYQHHMKKIDSGFGFSTGTRENKRATRHYDAASRAADLYKKKTGNEIENDIYDDKEKTDKFIKGNKSSKTFMKEGRHINKNFIVSLKNGKHAVFVHDETTGRSRLWKEAPTREAAESLLRSYGEESEE